MPSSLEASSEPASDADHDSSDSQTLKETIERDESRNLLVLALYQITVRVGWVFKTETVIMPAFLDAIGGGPVLRGLLPVLNKFGMSVPPVLVAGTIKKAPQKKWLLLASTLGMSVPFFVLSWLWQAGILQTGKGQGQTWVPWLFLGIYSLFSCITGITQLNSNTLQGKLIRPHHRGRLMVMAMAFGTPISLLAAWSLLGDWLSNPAKGYGYIFMFCGGAFVLGSGIAIWLKEPSVLHHDKVKRPRDHFIEAWQVLKTDADFRRLGTVFGLFGMVFMLFPHYQAMGRSRFDFNSSNLLTWVLIQNVGIGLFSLVAGTAADRWGNRLVLRIALFSCITPPLLATFLTWIDPGLGARWFWLVFLAMGTMPIVLKISSNYALEISSTPDHPRYISTLGLCLAVPIIIGSPLVGMLIGQLGFKPVCLGGSVIIALGAAYTFRLREPRHAAILADDEAANDNLFELDE